MAFCRGFWNAHTLNVRGLRISSHYCYARWQRLRRVEGSPQAACAHQTLPQSSRRRLLFPSVVWFLARVKAFSLNITFTWLDCHEGGKLPNALMAFSQAESLTNCVMPAHIIELGKCVGAAEDKLVYQLCVNEGNGRRERDNSRRFQRWPFVRAKGELSLRSDEWLTLETSAIVSFTASVTLINTQLIHQFESLTGFDNRQE